MHRRQPPIRRRLETGARVMRFDIRLHGEQRLHLKKEYFPITVRPDALAAPVVGVLQQRAGSRALQSADEPADVFAHRTDKQMHMRQFNRTRERAHKISPGLGRGNGAIFLCADSNDRDVNGLRASTPAKAGAIWEPKTCAMIRHSSALRIFGCSFINDRACS